MIRFYDYLIEWGKQYGSEAVKEEIKRLDRDDYGYSFDKEIADELLSEYMMSIDLVRNPFSDYNPIYLDDVISRVVPIRIGDDTIKDEIDDSNIPIVNYVYVIPKELINEEKIKQIRKYSANTTIGGFYTDVPIEIIAKMGEEGEEDWEEEITIEPTDSLEDATFAVIAMTGAGIDLTDSLFFSELIVGVVPDKELLDIPELSSYNEQSRWQIRALKFLAKYIEGKYYPNLEFEK